MQYGNGLWSQTLLDETHMELSTEFIKNKENPGNEGISRKALFRQIQEMISFAVRPREDPVM